jgi:hypothetical protein
MNINKLKKLIAECINDALSMKEDSSTGLQLLKTQDVEEALGKKETMPKDAIDLKNTDFSKLTIDNLRSLLRKCRTFKKYDDARQQPNKVNDDAIECLKQELQRRIDYIKKPV